MAKPRAIDSFAHVEPATRADWRGWLDANHATAPGCWFVSATRAGGGALVPQAEAIEDALCFGWIDSLPRKLDATRTMLLMSPRKPGSNWSRINKARVERMLAAGLMQPAGLAKIEAAQQDGSWEALDAVDRLEIPADLAAAFDERPGSRAAFEAFPASARRGILEWIGNAVKLETRAARIEDTALRAEQGERANQWRPKR